MQNQHITINRTKRPSSLWRGLLLLIFSFSFSSLSLAAVRVVASTTDLAAIAREVGGDLVQVESLCRGDQDPHEFEVLPAQVTTIQQADVYLKVGLALDAWADKLIAGAGNRRLTVIDCSNHLELLGKGGDGSNGAHPLGNPHYWLAPSTFALIGATIRDGLIQADPARQADWEATYAAFAARADSAYVAWKATMAPCRGMAVVTEHASWDYFVRDFGLEIAGIVNRIPEAEPTPLDLARLEQTITSRRVRIYLREPCESPRIPEVLARDTGIRIVLAPTSVGAVPAARDLWSHFDYLIGTLSAACSESR
jgi:zinc/manganese transport system substrate-binding protein